MDESSTGKKQLENSWRGLHLAVDKQGLMMMSNMSIVQLITIKIKYHYLNRKTLLISQLITYACTKNNMQPHTIPVSGTLTFLSGIFSYFIPPH